MRRISRVTARVQETPSTATLRFDLSAPALPGQFVMVWLPGEDELPMSLSYVGVSKGVTVKRMGETSGHMAALPVGATVGIRGPYGGHFDLTPSRVLIVGGGSGTAVLAPAAEAAAERGARVTVALGATTASELLFADRLGPPRFARHVATDDGSRGHHGFVTDVAEELLGSEEFDVVWSCGPEVMMKKVVTASAERSVPVYCSVERHMKCAVGLCDACALGPFHVCTDGPVFPATALAPLAEFGGFHRDSSGRRVGH